MWIMAMPSIRALGAALARCGVTKVAHSFLILILLLLNFQHRWLIQDLQWDWALFANSDPQGPVVHVLKR